MVPKWALKNMGLRSQREYKSLKRKQVRQVIKEMESLQLGCAYAAGYEDGLIDRINADLKELKERMSVNNWGR